MDESKTEAQRDSVNPVTIDEVTGAVDLPQGWMYKRWNLPWGSTWYASPMFQLILVSFVCFMCPGMFNALGGIGGGGKADATLADNMVSLSQKPHFLHSLFFWCCFFPKIRRTPKSPKNAPKSLDPAFYCDVASTSWLVLPPMGAPPRPVMHEQSTLVDYPLPLPALSSRL